MTSILILGGGEVGAAAARFAADIPSLERIVIADIDAQAARRAATAAGAKAVALALDVRDDRALRAALHGQRAVLNFVGPYFRFARPTVEAAIDAGIPYLDVNDDWEPTLDVLELDQRARERGSFALLGMGASPGITNLLAVLALREMPDATELITAWRGDGVDDGYSAAKEHWLHQCSGIIRILRDGLLVDTTPLESLTIDHPGAGRIGLVTLGHPEPVTLARRFPQLQHSVNAMALPPGLHRLLLQVRSEIDAGQLSLRRAAEDFAARYRASGPDDLTVVNALPGVFAVARKPTATGWSSVIATNHAYAQPGLGPVTAGPTVAALRMVLDGRLRKPGVHTPEDVLDPETLLDEYAAVFRGTAPIWRLDRC